MVERPIVADQHVSLKVCQEKVEYLINSPGFNEELIKLNRKIQWFCEKEV